MKPYFEDVSVTVYAGDCMDVMREMQDSSVDSVVTDPPYNLAFMSNSWDTHASAEEFERWCEAWARECLRILKPGGHLIAFGGGRTYHRLTCGIDDAGFEVRDSIAWLYGSGFPKSLDVSKAIDKAASAEREVVGPGRYADRGRRVDNRVYGKATPSDADVVTLPATDAAKQWEGWGTALKPAHEPVVVARKPLRGTVAQNVLAYGTGALNVDGCRIVMNDSDRAAARVPSRDKHGYGNLHAGVGRNGEIFEPPPGGRWPTNVVLDDIAAAELDRQSGVTASRSGGRSTHALGVMNDDAWVAKDMPRTGHDDSGGASRFFPVFKYTAKAGNDERPEFDGVRHPTVKPVDLMQWLVRLVTSPGGTVLDPFAGSGTTGEAAIQEHLRAILIEREPDYAQLIKSRLSKPMEIGFDFKAVTE